MIDPMRTLSREEALESMYMSTHKGYISSLSFTEMVRTIGSLPLYGTIAISTLNGRLNIGGLSL